MKVIKEALKMAAGVSPLALLGWFYAYHIAVVDGVECVIYEEGDLLHLLLKMFGVE